MSLKLIDVQCQSCDRVFEDVLVDHRDVDKELTAEELGIECGASCSVTCGRGIAVFKKVMSVPTTKGHSSWKV